MKLLLSLFALMIISSSIAQNESNDAYFAQCLFDIQDQTVLSELEAAIMDNPKVKLVRLSLQVQLAFIMTNEIESLTETELRSWFGEYGDGLTCIQIGIDGVDDRNPFPFTNCED